MAADEATRKQLLAEARRRVAAADGGDAGTLATQRQTAEKYYRGDPFGDEVSGRSQVVSRDVAQYVDSQMPSLMRIFASGDEVVLFEPAGPEDEEAAKQATDYVNWVWRQNDGFLRFHNWFKDGLLAKLGVVKIWWDESPRQTRETYRDLSDAQLEALTGDPDIEVGEVTTTELLAIGLDGTPIAMNAHQVVVVQTNRTGRIRVANVPPEEFRFGARTRDDSESSVFAHVRNMLRGDLVAMGFDPDVVAGLSGGDGSGDMDGAKVVRFRDVDDGAGNDVDEDEVEVVEAYFRWAAEDDEAPRHWMVTYSGSEVLACEAVDDHPFACVTPVLMPHRLVGMSTADQTMDLQRVKSTIWRQMLDNLYLTNMPQIGAVEGQVNLDDLLTRRPNGVVRMKSPGGIVPIPTTPLGAEPYQMIEYLDAQGEQRTGATRYNQGLDANTLNKTAAGINLIQNAGAQRLELIARVFAETGVKRAFRRILALLHRHQTKPQMIKLRNRWVEMDPRGWSTGMDLTVTVGLGNGSKDQTLAHMMTLLQLDAQIVQMQGGVQGPLVTAENIFAKLKKLAEAAGLRNVDTYYTDPSSPEMQQAMAQKPPKPDPKMLEVQGKLELEKLNTQTQMELEQRRTEHESAMAEQKARQDMELATWKAQQEAALERQKLEQQAELARITAGIDIAKAAAAQQMEARMMEFEAMHSAMSEAGQAIVAERGERARLAEEAAARMAEPEEDADDMPKGPSDEYKAMATMATSVQGAIEALAQIAAAQQQTQAEMVTLLRKVAAPRRAVRDADGKIVGSEASE